MSAFSKCQKFEKKWPNNYHPAFSRGSFIKRAEEVREHRNRGYWAANAFADYSWPVIFPFFFFNLIMKLFFVLYGFFDMCYFSFYK